MADISTPSWQGKLIDAYAHVGVPKYGTLQNVVIFFERLNIEQGNLVMGPGIPDLFSMMLARQRFGSHVRLMGIPFGDTEAQRCELGELQLRIGISGMRLMPDELLPNQTLIDQLGDRGLWLYAINPDQSADATRFLLDWLDRYPKGKVASPHFLRPQTIEQRVEDVALFQALMQHPSYHAIFSRHGGNGSVEAYPHFDLRPWVEEMAELVTWQRILWGSEFPIIYQRSEQPEDVRDWLLNLGVSLGEDDAGDYYANNAQRLFFDEPKPAGEIVEVPAWVEEQIDQASTVYLFPHNRIFVPMHDHRTLLTEYLRVSQIDADLTYADFIADILSTRAAQIRD